MCVPQRALCTWRERQHRGGGVGGWGVGIDLEELAHLTQTFTIQSPRVPLHPLLHHAQPHCIFFFCCAKSSLMHMNFL